MSLISVSTFTLKHTSLNFWPFPSEATDVTYFSINLYIKQCTMTQSAECCSCAVSIKYQKTATTTTTTTKSLTLSLNEKCLKVFWKKKKSGEWTISRKITSQKEQEDQAEKWYEIGKGNQMTALRFQTRGRYQTSPASLSGYPADPAYKV